MNTKYRIIQNEIFVNLKFQWGQSFYIGIAALVMFFVALGIDIGGTALVCITAKQERQTYRDQLFFVDDRGARHEKRRDGDAADAQPMIQSLASKNDNAADIGRNQRPRIDFSSEPKVWKFPKMTRV